MKRIWFLPVFCLILSLGGCSFFVSGEESDAQADAPLVLLDGQTEVYGKVKTAYGNEITIVVGTPVQGGDSPGAEQGGGPDMDAADTEERSSEQSGTPGEKGMSRTGTGGFPGEGGMDRAAGGGLSGQSRQGGRGQSREGGGNNGGPAMGGGMSGNIALEYGDEERTYQIPVTASITTGMGENARTVRFTQLGTKNIVRLVLDENDTILSLQILA